MKKFIVSSLIGFLILVFGAVSYAMEFKATGFIETSGHLGRNIAQPPYDLSGNLYGGRFTGGALTGFNLDWTQDPKRSWMESRARLRFDAIADKNLQGTIYLELDSSRWGEPPTGERGKAGAWGADRTAFEVKNAYVTFGLPVIPVPVTMNVGIQPLFQRPSILVFNDGPGITAGIKIDPARIKLFWFKQVENNDYASDDCDIYGLDISAKVQTVTVGGYAMHYNMNTYPIGTGATTGVITTAPTNRATMTWLGLYADGKLGPVNVNFDFAFDTGKVEARTGAGPIPFLVGDTVDYRGWAVLAKIDYPWEKLNFGLTFIYGTGVDTEETDTSGIPGNPTSIGTPSDKVSGYVVPPMCETGGDVSLIFFGTGGAGANRMVTAMIGSNAIRMNPGQQGGVWGIGPRVSYQVTPEYKAEFRALWIGDNVKNGNAMGDAVEPTGLLRDDSDIGIEVNLINYFKIYKNLLLNVGLGYLWVGDAFDYENPLIPGTNSSPEDPWVAFTRLVYLF